MNDYICFGLKIESEIECPKLISWHRDCEKPDMQIVLGAVTIDKVNSMLIDGYAWVSPGCCAFEIPQVARFLVHGGCKIVVEPLGQLKSKEIQAYLMGTAMGVLMHQRGDMPLHVSAVSAADRRAIVFAGNSGAGKSTIAAFLMDVMGFEIVTDDVLRLECSDESNLHATYGPRNIKLWQDACERLGFAPTSGIQDFAREKKFHFSTAAYDDAEPLKVRDFVFLARSPDEKIRLRQVYGEDHLRIIISSIYRSAIGASIQGENRLFKKCVAITQQTQGFILERPRSLAHLGAGITEIKRAGLL